MMSLSELAERCKAARGPSRQLDRDIWLGVIADYSQRELVHLGRSLHGDDEAEFRIERMADGFAPTASLDAALSLVPKGAGVTLKTPNNLMGSGMPSGASVHWGGNPETVASAAATPALAICAAALKARAAQAERRDDLDDGDDSDLEAWLGDR